MFEWKIEENEHVIQCPLFEHAVGYWHGKRDHILACNAEWIFTIDVQSKAVVILEARKNFYPTFYPKWDQILPELSPFVLVSDLFYKLCSTEPGHYFITSSMMLSPKSITFAIDDLVAATFLHLCNGSRIVLLFADKILISDCADWWQGDHLTCVQEITNDGNFTCLLSDQRSFIANGQHCVAGFDKTGKTLWQHRFESKIQKVWLLESTFQVAMLFSSGQLALIDRVSGKSLVDKPSVPFSLHDNAFIIIKNSVKVDGNSFYIVSQKLSDANGELHTTTIRQITAKRVEQDFIKPQNMIQTS